MEIIIPPDCTTVHRALASLGPGKGILGITNSSWSKIDALRVILGKIGPANVTISTWTAASANLDQAHALLNSKKITSLRLCVDRSFLTRQPAYSKRAYQLFGGESIRIWPSHAKFFICENAESSIIYLTSANLNQNPRLENFQCFWDAEIAQRYLDLVDALFERQIPRAKLPAPGLVDEIMKNI
ncbi:MAG: hypothetical protein OXI59_19170 [Gemmatimonadota bacterium]|nr:hypothetical protein [Gemmatimonadota bacterium]